MKRIILILGVLFAAVGLYYSKYVRMYERQIHVTAGFAF